MERYFKPSTRFEGQGPSSQTIQSPTVDQQNLSHDINSQAQVVITPDNLVSDPGLRPCLYSIAHNPKDLENIRIAYWLKGPCQPNMKRDEFPQSSFSGFERRFNPDWFQKYGSWLEYSVNKDAAFCLCCYLFKSDHGGQGGGDSFVTLGFRNWKKVKKLSDHVGLHNSLHNKCLKACQDLLNGKQHIDIQYANITEQDKKNYRIRLNASLRCIRYLLRQGLAFRGHDELEMSSNKGNFFELLKLHAEINEESREVLFKKAPGNHQLTSPDIQKDIITSAAALTTRSILSDVGDELFSLLVDESRDVSVKEQMGVVLRFVDKKGFVMERFLGVVHVESTTAQSLKSSIDSFFSKRDLSISRLRGQGYDGPSNMKGEFHGLKSLILAENKSAYYIHCFTHQLQLTLVAVAKKHSDICAFFETLTRCSTIIAVSPKRKEIFREKQTESLLKGISSGEIMTGKGLNQEGTLARPGDTRWGSHYRTILSVIKWFSPMIGVLEAIQEDGNSEQCGVATNLLSNTQQFHFIFILHFMQTILGISNELSQALQRKDQDIINAMSLVKVTRERFNQLRNDGWEKLLNSTLIDLQLQEINSRFDNVSTELLGCVACLDPRSSFSAFDKERLVRLAEFYPSDFSPLECMDLENQLESYILDVRGDDEFSNLVGISELAQKMVAKKKHIVFPSVHLLLKLALLLPVATATVERVFSAMNIIKTPLRNRMSDDLLNGCLVTYIERDVFDTIDDDSIMKYFQKMKSRKVYF